MATATPQPSTARSYTGILADRLAGWLYGMPAETCGFTVEHVRIPIPAKHFAPTTNTTDSNTIQTAAVLFQPTNQPQSQAPLGTILVRSPYGLDYPLAVGHARIFAARGYQVLLCACRGTAGSEGGVFTPAMDDVADGSAVVLWVREQEWYTGRWGMLGGSYLAWAQWSTVHGLQLRKLGLAKPEVGGGGDDDTEGMAQQAAAAADALSELKAMIVLVGPHDWGAFTFGTGAMNPDMVSWVGAMAAMERKETWLPPPFHMSWHRERMARDLSAVSLMDGMRRYIGGELPEWFDGIVTGNVEFPVATDALERIEGTAVLVVAGWADTFIEQCLVQYRRLKERGQVVGLTVGPWGHLSAQGGESKREILQWLDQYLAPKTAVKAKQESRKALVRIFDTGTKQWLETDAWPLENTRTTQWFLSAEGRLEASPPGAAPAETSFEYDPRNPTPNIGSSMLNYQAGKLADDRSLAARSDVIAFTTEPLEQDIRVMGSPVLSLAHSSSHPFADLSVRVCAVEANGTSHNISEAYQRLDKLDRGPETGELLQLTLVECAHTFRKGTRIRVVIAGGSHPKYVRNLGTGEDMVHGVNMESVKHTVHHGGERASSLTLPVDV